MEKRRSDRRSVCLRCAMSPDQPSTSFSQRRGPRFVSQYGFVAMVMAIDGTWYRDCKIMDISDFGGMLRIDQSVEGLCLQEFFLVLSRTGTAHRICQMVWFRGTELGVNFVRTTGAAYQFVSKIPGTNADETFSRRGRRRV